MRPFLVLAILAVWITAPGARGAAEPLSPTQAPDYRLAPGDVLEITLAPQHELDRTVTVQPDGQISFPFVGLYRAGGLTTSELGEKLRQQLDRDLVSPHVTVSLKELNHPTVPRVSVLGAVRNPGVFDIREGSTLADALAAAGGPLPMADLRRVMITRTDRTVKAADLVETGKSGRLDGNVVLVTGDIVVVPEGSPATVLVLGEVARPGSIELHGQARLLDALSLAGGPTPNADLHRIALAQPGIAGTQTLDLQPLLSGASSLDPRVNVMLAPGDTIVLPKTDQQVYILGRVAKPDIYPLQPSDRVLDLLARAGGATADGDLGRVVLVRKDPSGQPVPKGLDLKRMMAQGTMTGNEPLRPGDVLFVPDKKPRRNSPIDLANLLFPITALLNVLH
jgi:protein involved in polysaccharide export with SLBB domain